MKVFFSVLMLLLLAVACSDRDQQYQNSDGTYVSIQLPSSQKLKSNLDLSITKVSLELWDDKFFSLGPIFLEESNGVWGTYLTEFPKQSELNWRALAYNSQDQMIYKGETKTEANDDFEELALVMKITGEDENSPPVIEKLSMPKLIALESSIELVVSIADQDGDDMEVNWLFDKGAIVSGGNTERVTYSARVKGKVIGRVEVSDGNHVSNYSFSFFVKEDEEFLNETLIPVTGLIFNAKNKSLLEGVHVNFEGRDANVVCNGKGVLLENLYSAKGLVNFYIKPSETNEIDFQVRLVFEKEDHLMTSLELFIEHDQDLFFDISMVPLELGDLEDVELFQTKAYSQGGKLLGNVVMGGNSELSYNDEVVKGGLELLCLDGVELRDEAGELIDGLIEMNMTYHNPMSGNALELFPGGLDAVFDENENENGTFISGGFTAIEMQNQSGQKVKTFSKPLQLKMLLDPNIINPVTKTKLKTGDSIPIWSYSSPEASWSAETTATVQGPNENGLLFACFEVEHLSYWNLDWVTNTTVYESELHVVDEEGQYVDFDYYLELSRIGGGFKKKRKIRGDGKMLRLARVPGGESYTFNAYDAVNPNIKIGALTSRLDEETGLWSDNTLVLKKLDYKQVKINFEYLDLANTDTPAPAIRTSIVLKSVQTGTTWQETTNLEGSIAFSVSQDESALEYSVFHRFLDKWVDGIVLLSSKDEYHVNLIYNSEDLFPEKPIGITGSYDDYLVNLTWDEDEKAKLFKVYLSQTEDVNENSTFIRSYKNSIKFSYYKETVFLKIVAENQIGESEWSDLIRLDLNLNPPSYSPQSITARPDDEQILLWWSEVKLASEYKVYRSLEESFGQAQLLVTTDDSYFFDTTVSNDQVYYYWIVASNASGDSPVGDAVSVSAIGSPPQGVDDVEGRSNGRVNQLTWSESARTDYYEIEWYASDNLNSGLEVSQNNNWGHFLMDEEISYSYRVRGVNDSGNGAFGNWIEVMPSFEEKKVIYINQNIGMSGNGTSWEEAYQSLLDIPSYELDNVEIWMTKGVHITYDEDNVFNDFYGSNLVGVDFYGGFDGVETTRDLKVDLEARSSLKSRYGLSFYYCQNCIFKDISNADDENYFYLGNSNDIYFVNFQSSLVGNGEGIVFSIHGSENVYIMKSEMHFSGISSSYRNISIDNSSVDFLNTNFFDIGNYLEHSVVNFDDCWFSGANTDLSTLGYSSSTVSLNDCVMNAWVEGQPFMYGSGGDFFAKACTMTEFTLSIYGGEDVSFVGCNINLNSNYTQWKLMSFIDSPKIDFSDCYIANDSLSWNYGFYLERSSIDIHRSILDKVGVGATDGVVNIVNSDLYVNLDYGSSSFFNTYLNIFSSNVMSNTEDQWYFSESNIKFEDLVFENVVFNFQSDCDINMLNVKGVHNSGKVSAWTQLYDTQIHLNESHFKDMQIFFDQSNVDMSQCIFEGDIPSFNNCDLSANSVVISSDDSSLYASESNVILNNSILEMSEICFFSTGNNHQYNLNHILWREARVITLGGGHLDIWNSIFDVKDYFYPNISSGEISLNYLMTDDFAENYSGVNYNNYFIATPDYLDSNSITGADGLYFTEDDGWQLLNSSDGIGAGVNFPQLPRDATGKLRSVLPNLGPYESPY